MGRLKGSKDLKPRKKRIDKPKTRQPRKMQPIHAKGTKRGRGRERDYDKEFNDWLSNVLAVVIATGLVFIGLMVIIILNFI